MPESLYKNLLHIFFNTNEKSGKVYTQKTYLKNISKLKTLLSPYISDHMMPIFESIFGEIKFYAASGNQTLKLSAFDFENIESILAMIAERAPSKTDISNKLISILVYFYSSSISTGAQALYLNSPEVRNEYKKIEQFGRANEKIELPRHTSFSHKAEIEKIKREITEYIQEEKRAFSDVKKNEIREIKEDISTRVSAAVEALKADATLTEAYALWKDKEHLHRENFRKGIFLFLGAVAIAIALISAAWPDISKFVTTDVEKLPNLISRTIIISLPISLLIWILRAILRWANMNLSLAEDAAQRRVLANTYVNLLATEKEHLPEERAIMLNAIFRPLPGVREMDVEPTTIVDIVKAARGK